VERQQREQVVSQQALQAAAAWHMLRLLQCDAAMQSLTRRVGKWLGVYVF
jgi:hypothetical protein